MILLAFELGPRAKGWLLLLVALGLLALLGYVVEAWSGDR